MHTNTYKCQREHAEPLKVELIGRNVVAINSETFYAAVASILAEYNGETNIADLTLHLLV